MTPQLQQAIRLLQLPALDLQAHVRETLETNVMLEADDDQGSGYRPRGAARARGSAGTRGVRRARRQVDRGRPARGAGSRDRRRSLGRTDDGSLRITLVGRRRPQRRLQRPALIDAARTADRAIGTRETLADRPRDRARDRRFDIRRRLSAGGPGDDPCEPAAGDLTVDRGRGARAQRGPGLGARGRRRAQSRRMHRAAAASVGRGDADARHRHADRARTPGPRRGAATRAATAPVAVQRERSRAGSRAGAVLPSAARVPR